MDMQHNVENYVLVFGTLCKGGEEQLTQIFTKGSIDYYHFPPG
jgi:hypothetical protein